MVEDLVETVDWYSRVFEAELARDLYETDFGWRRFAVEDCNDYVLWFGEKLDDQEALDVGRRHRSLVRRHHG